MEPVRIHPQNNGRLAVVLALLTLSLSLPASESVDALNPLFKTYPAERYVAVEDWEAIRNPDLPLVMTTGVFRANSGLNALPATVIHLESLGYGGAVGVLVAFDPAGTILRVNVFRHNETQCHVVALADGRFTGQFAGISMTDKLRLLVGGTPSGRGDVQAMTGGTVTSRAVGAAVAEARTAFYQLKEKGFLGKP